MSPSLYPPFSDAGKVSCGAEFTAIIDNRGRLLTFGSPQEGQLGSGTTGEFIEKAGKISYDLVLSPSVINVFISKVRYCSRSQGHWGPSFPPDARKSIGVILLV